MKIVSTPIQGIYVVETKPFQDERGTFYRAFCDRELDSLLEGKTIRQVNLSRTEAAGAIRGMHFQYPPHAEIKLIRCLKGRVSDVAVDLRQDSSTFLKWYQTELSAANAYMIMIPQGCAHGFQVLEPSSELLYLHTAYYEPKSEGGIRYSDPKINISWPLKATDVSPRDASHPLLSEDFRGIVL
ncbi:dTDP-4-dehydrorhamnose 3,5-epimerase family protein [Oscillatoria acuminata]|uniref:dTDP-4-dehydrorhamnose 3,5-epimerase-like enzyme n=1 Tax=Oscillatoria acuminata PCC 6304 TaxID=56110 RepID=K9TJR0_9CYAN|nr:dTDP-4-dehydrorhamnose 3,5-epimerase family protein [Oscillatoria acuminata]AFY83097.1 dTDP-4-dehydrorhamnose 3,5-epimerase-like enzyme [Oscillatoria acuminata PCC 6304]